MIWDPNGFFYYQFLKSDKCKHDDCTLLLVIKKKICDFNCLNIKICHFKK